MSVATELTAGGVAGAAGILSTQPLDTIRIRLQSPIHCPRLGRTYTGLADCLKATLHNEGIRGLYKGVASPTLTVGGMNALLFFSYEEASKLLRQCSGVQEGQELPIRDVYIAGAASGLASAFVTAPTELVKCLAQVNIASQGRMSEEWIILRDMVRHQGFFGAHGPCRGLLATIIREVPSFGLYFAMYEGITRSFEKSHFVNFVAGGCAGATAWAMIYPLDVVKTRWQTAPALRYQSLRHCAVTILRTEGRGAFFRGFGATMARAWPQNGVIFCTYELVKGFLAG